MAGRRGGDATDGQAEHRDRQHGLRVVPMGWWLNISAWEGRRLHHDAWSRATQHDMFHNDLYSSPPGRLAKFLDSRGQSRCRRPDESAPRRVVTEVPRSPRDPPPDDILPPLRTPFPEAIGFDEQRIATTLSGRWWAPVRRPPGGRTDSRAASSNGRHTFRSGSSAAATMRCCRSTRKRCASTRSFRRVPSLCPGLHDRPRDAAQQNDQGGQARSSGHPIGDA